MITVVFCSVNLPFKFEEETIFTPSWVLFSENSTSCCVSQLAWADHKMQMCEEAIKQFNVSANNIIDDIAKQEQILIQDIKQKVSSDAEPTLNFLKSKLTPLADPGQGQGGNDQPMEAQENWGILWARAFSPT